MTSLPVQTAVHIPADQIAAFCLKHHITRLWLFGSVLRPDFRPDSDVDVLVEFDPAHIPGWKIVSIQDELSALLGRAVELSMPDALSRHTRIPILRSARLIYERV
ncbi:MAG: nucleotidyltransferase family protein [Anaerolineae bacterium]|nr:nucleotidyltransferase family protein [Anaerolineae bacterium]